MKRVSVFDTSAGHAVGWNSDGATVTFVIDEEEVTGDANSFVSVKVDPLGGDTNFFCDTVDLFLNAFKITCSIAPPDTSSPDYVVVNLPPNFIF
jgi:hypothetical protein